MSKVRLENMGGTAKTLRQAIERCVLIYQDRIKSRMSHEDALDEAVKPFTLDYIGKTLGVAAMSPKLDRNSTQAIRAVIRFTQHGDLELFEKEAVPTKQT